MSANKDTYQRHVAVMRAFIEEYGISNGLNVLIDAVQAESEELDGIRKVKYVKAVVLLEAFNKNFIDIDYSK